MAFRHLSLGPPTHFNVLAHLQSAPSPSTTTGTCSSAQSSPFSSPSSPFWRDGGCAPPPPASARRRTARPRPQLRRKATRLERTSSSRGQQPTMRWPTRCQRASSSSSICSTRQLRPTSLPPSSARRSMTRRSRPSCARTLRSTCAAPPPLPTLPDLTVDCLLMPPTHCFPLCTV